MLGRWTLGPVVDKGWADIRVIVVGFDCGRSGFNTGRLCHGGLDRQEFGLDIVEVRKTAGAANGGIKKVTIRCHVHLHDKGRKEDMHAKTVHANETTTPLALMSPKTV